MKALLLNDTEMALPFLRAAKKLGIDVYTTGTDPDALIHDYSDGYYPGDILDFDRMEQIVREHGIEATLIGIKDDCALTAAYLTEKLGLPGHDNIEVTNIMHHKHDFKAFSEKYNIKTPLSDRYNSLESALAAKEKYTKFPIIVKPATSAAGRGVTKLEDPSGYEDAVRAAWTETTDASFGGESSTILIEPFITGRLYTCFAFIVDGKVRDWMGWEDFSFMTPYAVTRGHTIGKEDVPCAEVIAGEIQKMADAVHLVDGPIDAQYIVQDGEPWIIEVMRRSPGNYTTEFASLATGVDWNEWIVKAETGMDCSDMPALAPDGATYGYGSMMSSKAGTFKDVIIDESIVGNIKNFRLWGVPGQPIVQVDFDKVGVVHMRFDTYEEAVEKMRDFHDLVRVEVIE